MSQDRPTSAEISVSVASAWAAVNASAAQRKRWRRRQAPTRQVALEGARAACEAPAPQLRSWIGMCAWSGISLDDEIAMKKVMEALRYERRQIDKMLA